MPTISLGKYVEAKDTYSTIIATNSHDHDAFQFRGATYVHLKDYEKALTDLNRALELNPDDYVAINDRGVVFTNLQEYEKALADFNHLLEFKPGNPSTLYNLACLFSLQGKTEDGRINTALMI